MKTPNVIDTVEHRLADVIRAIPVPPARPPGGRRQTCFAMRLPQVRSMLLAVALFSVDKNTRRPSSQASTPQPISPCLKQSTV